MSARDAGAAFIFFLLERLISLSKVVAQGFITPGRICDQFLAILMALSLSPGDRVAVGECDTGPEFFQKAGGRDG